MGTFAPSEGNTVDEKSQGIVLFLASPQVLEEFYCW